MYTKCSLSRDSSKRIRLYRFTKEISLSVKSVGHSVLRPHSFMKSRFYQRQPIFCSIASRKIDLGHLFSPNFIINTVKCNMLCFLIKSDYFEKIANNKQIYCKDLNVN